MTKIILQNQTARMCIHTQGAYVDSLSLLDQTVFFPKTTLTINGAAKLRGGLHPCLPQFGPDGGSGLGHHGFGRTAKWLLAESSASSAGLLLQQAEAGYQDIDWRLDYSLPQPDQACFRLSAHNRGKTPVRIAPGFHPYFYAADSEFTLGTRKYDACNLNDVRFAAAAEKAAVGRLDLAISQKNLPVFALWSDRADDYICIEPTAAGDAFLLHAGAGQNLLPGEKKRYELCIRLQQPLSDGK